jgi:hypothetical protein
MLAKDEGPFNVAFEEFESLIDLLQASLLFMLLHVAVARKPVERSDNLAWDFVEEVPELGPLKWILRDKMAASLKRLSHIPADQVAFRHAAVSVDQDWDLAVRLGIVESGLLICLSEVGLFVGEADFFEFEVDLLFQEGDPDPVGERADLVCNEGHFAHF